MLKFTKKKIFNFNFYYIISHHIYNIHFYKLNYSKDASILYVYTYINPRARAMNEGSSYLYTLHTYILYT